jgi:hypothetical protein
MQSEVILQNRTMGKLFSPHGMQTGRLFFESSTICCYCFVAAVTNDL